MEPALARAQEAWASLIRTENPMPVEIALDYVQDVTDDRSMAVELLFEAGREWLRSQQATSTGTISNWAFEMGADDLIDKLKPDESVDFADLLSFRKAIRARIREQHREGRPVTTFHNWRKWALKAEKAFDILDAVQVKSGA